MEAIFIISIVIIGGAGNLWGSVVGSVVLAALPELLRFVGLPNSIAANALWFIINYFYDVVIPGIHWGIFIS